MNGSCFGPRFGMSEGKGAREPQRNHQGGSASSQRTEHVWRRTFQLTDEHFRPNRPITGAYPDTTRLVESRSSLVRIPATPPADLHKPNYIQLNRKGYSTLPPASLARAPVCGPKQAAPSGGRIDNARFILCGGQPLSAPSTT